MKTAVSILSVVTVSLAVGAALCPLALRSYPEVARFVSPGDLSSKHAFISNDCESCHSALKGIDATKCISCHANSQALLGREPTAFHSEIKDCRGCHVEHQGRSAAITRMAHGHLAAFAIRLRGATRDLPPETHDLIRWLRRESPADSGQYQPFSQVLDCSTCHGTKDPHRMLFGKGCVDCHNLRSWKIAGYRHPPAESHDCAQCHQAPPSHYMEHFEMISEKIAGVEHADPRQCYLCHKTTSWNDIRGVGWYKHH